MTWKVLLVGLGNIGCKYDLDKPDNIIQTHARAFSLHADFQLIGGVDPNKKNRDEFEDRYSIRSFNTITDVYKNLLADVVVIASPTSCHLDNLKEVLSCSTPDVILMEKPASYTKDQAQQMIALSNNALVPVFVNLIRRIDPSVQKIKSFIDNGIIKMPCKGVVWYSKGLIHNACHFIDLLSWWLGAPNNVEIIDVGRQVNEWDLELDLKIRFADSTVYFLAKKTEEFNYYNIELLARNGRLTIEGGNVGVFWQAKSKNSTSLEASIYEINNELYQYQLNVANDLSCFLNKNKSLMPSLGEHVKTLNFVYNLVEGWKRR